MKLEEMQDIIDEQNLQVDEYMRSSRALCMGRLEVSWQKLFME